MSSFSPLSSSDQKQIQAIDAALEESIHQAEQGKLSQQDLAKIQQQLSQLAKNPKIPDSVRQNLQGVLNELKQIKVTPGAGESDVVGALYNLQFQMQHMIPQPTQTQTGEGASGGAEEQTEGPKSDLGG